MKLTITQLDIDNDEKVNKYFGSKKEAMEVAMKYFATMCHEKAKKFNATNINIKVAGIYDNRTGEDIGSLVLNYHIDEPNKPKQEVNE